MIDTHTHLNFNCYDNINEIIISLKKANISKCIVVGTNFDSSIEAIKLSQNYQGFLYSTIGIHPTDIKKYEDVLIFEELLLKYKDQIIAIGEVGLDYYHKNTSYELQKRVFKYFIELSIKYKLPLIIHSREAHMDCINILSGYKGKIFGVFHCFSGNLVEANQILALGFCLGIGGVLTFPNAKNLLEVVASIDLKHLLLETDCPFLSPQSNRGKFPNTPHGIIEVADKIAKIKKISLNVISDITDSNVKRVFGLDGHQYYKSLI